ncbi:glycosyltransferase family 4 protein [Longimicrobium sp.]|jgi:glycosyltransferase involved in cell wall biosynthesis|uniref:glycosyltransferase family 4 protein n=1 Tax=Longimicrobium sp. TaxID=2029185 RepID=UPI002ED9C259
MPRVLVVSNIPTPYNDALFARLARRPGVQLRVAYGAPTEANRAWALVADKGYEYQVLRGRTLAGSAHVNPGVVPLVARSRPDVAVLTGSYTMPTVQLAAAALGVSGVPWVYWGEELLHGPAPPARRALRGALRAMLRRARGVLAIGTRARASYERAGVRPERIADFRYYADTGAFQLSPGARAEARSRVRAELGMAPGTVAFVYAGQLIARKGVDTLLRAFARLHAPGAVAVVAGDGPDRDALAALARELGIAERVRFPGFVQPARLPGLFAAADAFVLPSHAEGWGVVVPEAMAAGLPVLASERVNAAADLVAEGRSGWLFPAGDDRLLGARMAQLCATPGLAARMGAAGRESLRDEQPAPAARRMVALLDAARAGRPLAGL